MKKIIVGRDLSILAGQKYNGYILHLMCESGNARFVLGDQVYELSAHCVVAIPDASAISGVSCDDDFRCIYVLVSDRFLHSLLPARNYSISGHLRLFSKPMIKVSAERASIFKEDMLAIERRVGEMAHRFYDEMVGGLLRTMVYDYFDMNSEYSESIPMCNRISDISRRFFLMLESGRPKYDREPESYASQLCVSRKYLNTVVKRTTGNSVSYHINRTATAVIIDYLKENRLSISQIAEEMNFTSLEYFSRYCKKHLGVSPSKYRNTIR